MRAPRSLAEGLLLDGGAVAPRSQAITPIPGKHDRALARRERPFFELSEPLVRTWNPGTGSEFGVSTSQLLEMILSVGTLSPSHCRLLALVFGLIDEDTPPDEVSGAVPRRSRESPLLDAIGLAAALDVPLLIEP